jgi:DNA-binding LacI/PurR family transcriptional regulator
MPRKGAAGAQPVTIAMVAQRAGVSRQTVSNAVNSPDLLRPETLARVQQAIDELGYRPQSAARTLRTRSSRLIGYGIRPSEHDRSTAVLDRFLHALSETADEAGYRILLFAAPDEQAELEAYDSLLSEHSVDAFVLSNTTRGDRRQSWMHKHGIPFVAFGRGWGARDIGDWVDVDGAAGTAQAVDHLVGLGHRRIAFLGWPRGSGVGDDRLAGWREAMSRHDLPSRGLRAGAVDEVEPAAEAVKPLFDAGVTAVVAASDTLAMGCYRALRAQGRVPGRDVSVTGFDDSPATSLLAPSLTSLHQPLEEIGRECMRLLLARMASPTTPPGRTLLSPRLVVRESSVPPSI